MLPFAVFLLATMAAVAGCADVHDSALQQDVSQLRQDVNALMLSAHRGRGDTETVLSQVDRRSREQSTETSRQLSAMSSRLDGLSAEVTRLSARLDEISQRLETLSRQVPADAPGSRSGSMAPSRPPSPPPVAAAPPPAVTPARPAPSTTPAPPTPAPPAPAPTAPPTAAPGSAAATASTGGSPEATFQAAYLDYSKGMYPLAISGFRDVLRRFPDSPQAENAQYFIGEAHFSMARASAGNGRAEEARRGLEQAVQEFRKVTVMYPRGSKVPTALYKEALALVELKQTALAQTRLQYLVDNFPQSEEALLAKERLAALKP